MNPEHPVPSSSSPMNVLLYSWSTQFDGFQLREGTGYIFSAKTSVTDLKIKG